MPNLRTIIVTDLDTRDTIDRFIQEEDAPLWPSLIWSPDGRYLASMTPNVVHIWEHNNPNPVVTVPVSHVASMAWSHDGRYLAFVVGHDIQICDALTFLILNISLPLQRESTRTLLGYRGPSN